MQDISDILTLETVENVFRVKPFRKYIEHCVLYCEMTSLTSDWIALIRSHYVQIKTKFQHIMNDIIDGMHFLNSEQLLAAILATSDTEKADIILSAILTNGESSCKDFAKFLKKRNVLSDQDFKGPASKDRPSNSCRLNEIQVEMFRNGKVKEYIKNELEIRIILDYLYEWNLINLAQHGSIRKANNRQEGVNLLFEIISEIREVEWFRSFCYILNQYGHRRIVDKLLQFTSTEVWDESVVLEDDIPPSFGKTMKIYTESTTENALRQHHIDDMNAQLAEHMQPIADVREGCVEFFFLSSTAAKLSYVKQQAECEKLIKQLTLLSDVKDTLHQGQKFRVLIKNDCSTAPLLNEIGKEIKEIPMPLAMQIGRSKVLEKIDVDQTVDVLRQHALIKEDVFQKIGDEHIQREYVFNVLTRMREEALRTILKQMVQKSQRLSEMVDFLTKLQCIGCLRSSILKYWKKILDEIDTDIMQMTLKDQDNIPQYIFEICVSKASTTSRLSRAKIFLQFILVKGYLLRTFAEVLVKRCKSFSWEHVSCTGCLKNGEPDDMEEKNEPTEFIFVVNDAGEIVCEDESS